MRNREAADRSGRMRTLSRLWRGAVRGGAIAVALAACDKATDPVAPVVSAERSPIVGTVTQYATGLNNPRGLRFGPDGALYVAEGGTGGTNSTVGQCEQVPGPVGPYTGSTTGARISRISSTGVRTTVVDNLPSSQTQASQGTLVSGVADVEFIGHTMYALLAGAGCSHGVPAPALPNGVIRVGAHGSWTMVANLSAFQQANPVANPDLSDFEPDGTWYSMVAVHGDLYAAEPNHQEIVRISPATGHIERVVDVSATSPTWIGPTSLTHRGNFFFGTLTPFPLVDGAASVYKLTPRGKLKVWASGFTMITGVAFDRHKRLYVLENTTGNPFPTPGTGAVIRVDPSGRKETIASGLQLPTAMTFGPDGNLYVSTFGFGPPPIGLGGVVKIRIE